MKGVLPLNGAPPRAAAVSGLRARRAMPALRWPGAVHFLGNKKGVNPDALN